MIKINPYSFPSLYDYVDNQNQTIDDHLRAGRIHTTAPAVVTAKMPLSIKARQAQQAPQQKYSYKDIFKPYTYNMDVNPNTI